MERLGTVVDDFNNERLPTICSICGNKWLKNTQGDWLLPYLSGGSPATAGNSKAGEEDEESRDKLDMGECEHVSGAQGSHNEESFAHYEKAQDGDPMSAYGLLIMDYRDILSTLEHARVVYYRRSANLSAYSLVKAVGSTSGCQEWNYHVPQCIASIFISELME